MADSAHQSVLLEEAVAALNIQPEGRYVDGTFGRGGHARRILKALDATGQLLVMDKDPTAIAEARRLQAEDARVHVAYDSFARLAEHVDGLGWSGGLQGVLLDLGVSSPQLDEAERGFSFMRDGPLDMRMNNRSGPSAYEWLRDVEESELVRVLKEYGEERFARRVARKIVQAREADELPERTVALAELIASAIPGREPGKHPATRSFQAIRIAVNAELDDLAACLESAPDLLAPGGRLVVIAFHSLEDRMVKRALRRRSSIGHLPPGLPVVPASMQPTLRLVGKAQKAAEGEVRGNVRSRSAVMRVAERLP